MPRSALHPVSIALVGVGGAAGAGARWVIIELVGTNGAFPWWTLSANVLGCFLLGLLLGADEGVRLGLGAGFCGGLTTFSTFSVEIATLLDTGSAGTAVIYLGASLAAGVVALVAGWRLAPLT